MTALDAASASTAVRSPGPSSSTGWLRLRKQSSRNHQQEANMRQLCKGNVAVIKGALLAGCRAYYGYPITPASEIAEAAALYLPEVGGTACHDRLFRTRRKPDAGRHLVPCRFRTSLRDC